MNFEELLETRDVRKTSKTRIPYGFFFKRLIDGKYSNFVQFHDELTDNVVFSKCVQKEFEAISKIRNKHQLQFTPNEGDDGIYAIAIDVGNYMTIEQFLNENPAVIAQRDYINNTLKDLAELTEELNDQGIYHVCFAPSNVLVRKSDGNIRLLCHGSYYASLDQEFLYEGVENYVAPEVFNGGTINERTDVYSFAKFIEYLYSSSGIPFELKSYLASATNENPESRPDSVKSFMQGIENRKNMKRTGVAAISALLIALSVLFLFFYLMPSPENIEYVEPVEEPVPDEMLEEDMEALYNIGPDADSAAIAAVVRRHQQINDSLGIGGGRMREYQAKAEAIFRKKYTKEADAILNKVYNSKTMNESEKEILSQSNSMSEELIKKQEELVKGTGLSEDRAQSIASEVIKQLTDKKKAELDKEKKDNE